MIWNAIGKRQRKGDAPLSMKDRPLYDRQCMVQVDFFFCLQFKPICEHDSEDVQGELDCNELATTRVFCGLSRPYGNNRVEYSSSDSVDKSRYLGQLKKKYKNPEIGQ